MVYEETTGSVAQEKLQVCVVVNSVLSNSLLLWELQVFHLQQQIIHMLNCTFACPPEMKSPVRSALFFSLTLLRCTWACESVLTLMEKDEEMSKTQAMWIKIKEPMAERLTQRKIDNGLNSILCSRKRQNTSPSYLFDCNCAKASPITQRKQLWGILCDCPQSKHSTAQNRVWCPRWV